MKLSLFLLSYSRMTKFILHGGGTGTGSKTDAFFQEMLKEVKERDRVLLVYFSRPREDWQRCFEQDAAPMQACISTRLEFELALPDAFDDQVRRADVIYMRGGHTPPLLEELERHPKFAELINGKVIAGSSAGAYALADYAYSIESQCVRRGLGILPIRVAAHYQGDDSFLKEFPGESEGLETVLLREGEYRVFKV